MKAIWKGTEIADSNNIVEVEGNAYFPRGDVHIRYLEETTQESTCPWKGVASYYNITVDGDVNKGAAWTYKHPKSAAEEIKDRIAFWRGVEVRKD